MNLSLDTTELLSPAKTADIGIAAVNHGADAVYIGGPAFGARHHAGNSLKDIERLVRHAHRYHARIFITLNTILHEDELEPARRMAQSVYDLGADALIIQDMGLLLMDLPPIQLHASTQCDIRTPEKARFLEQVGFSQVVAARELNLDQITQMAKALDQAKLEFFIHGALCVAYSGQCYISHAQTGRSANRGDCSQACRLPYEVLDAQGRIIAHQKHVLSVKDNDQSANLEALLDAGVRSFKIEGRYKDLAYVKNITSHYRSLLDDILDHRPGLSRVSSGQTKLHFSPDPKRSFNRESTDYFVQGRKADIGAFDTPKPQGLPLGILTKTEADRFEVTLHEEAGPLQNGDTVTYFDLHKELQGFRINIAEHVGDTRYLATPNQSIKELKDFRKGTELFRSREMSWERLMDSDRTAERRIRLDMTLTESEQGLTLELIDESGYKSTVHLQQAYQSAKDPERSLQSIEDALGKLGNTLFALGALEVRSLRPRMTGFWPLSLLNQLRREAIESLEALRKKALKRLPRAKALEPPARYPEDSLSYLANVSNHKAHQFYLNHGVTVVEPAYEAHETKGEVSLMITKHCVRFALSLCPKQTRGVTGVQGTIKADPLQLVSAGERLTLEFDCKACEMHVMGKIRRSVLKDVPAQPIRMDLLKKPKKTEHPNAS